MIFLKHVFIIVCSVLWVKATLAQDIDLKNFSTDTGECSLEEKDAITKKAIEENFELFTSYVLENVPIYRKRDNLQITGSVVEPLQTLNCLKRDGNKMLVTSLNPSKNSCGWIDISGLAASRSVTSLTGSSMYPCGKLAPLTIAEFCSKLKSYDRADLSKSVAALTCDLLGDESSIDAKFVPLNAQTPLFVRFNDNLKKTTKLSSSITGVYDVALTDQDEVRILLGSHGAIHGWSPLEDGAIIFSKLNVFFKEEGQEVIYYNMIFDNQSDEPFNNNIIMFENSGYDNIARIQDFEKFPVLMDLRRNSISSVIAPQLQIAIPETSCKTLSEKPSYCTGVNQIFKIPCEPYSEKELCEEFGGITGYIKTAKIFDREKNWNYFVALEKIEISDLRHRMADLCSMLGTGGDQTDLVEKAILTIVRTLTGDQKTDAEIAQQVMDGLIPLQSETIIGDGLADFLISVRDGKDMEYYKKEFCRSEILLDIMMEGETKLLYPEEGQDLIWDEDIYLQAADGKDFEWEVVNDLGERLYYLPLEYLPRKPTN